MKKLLLAVALMLPAASVSAEDHIHQINATDVAASKPEGTTTTAPAGDVTKSEPEKTEQNAEAAKPAIDCTGKLGVSRVAEVDTAGGGEYGEQYPPTKLLEEGEVVLTFDDGPHPKYTREILNALAEQCTKATFLNVGEMIKNFPDVSKEVQAAGHSVGTHTWSHRNLGAISLDRAKSQIESAINIADTTLPEGVAPFFRFPYLSDPKRVREYLASRNVAVLGIDVDSYDWRVHSPEKIFKNVFSQLDKTGKGIILFHDIHPQTAKAIPAVLAELQKRGYKVVHLVPKSRIETVAMSEPDAASPPHRRTTHKHHRRTRH